MKTIRVVPFAIALLVPAAVDAGEFVGFRTSVQNVNVGRVAKSTLLDGGNVIDVVRDELSGSLAVGGEYLNITNQMMFSLSFDYGSTRLLGVPTARYEYLYSDSLGNVTSSRSAEASQAARMSVGVGYSVVRTASTFMYVNPALTFEYGTRVTLAAAADQFIENDFHAPSELEVDSRLEVGLNLRLFSGVAIGENVSLAVAPSWSYGWAARHRATRDGLTEARLLTFDLGFGIYRAVTR